MASGLDRSADRMPSFDGATGWLGSPPLAPAELSGSVVLIQFWTFTCINWIRTLPYVRAWWERYREHGLVVIGVHTPEFEVEQDIDNVRRAADERRVRYPIALDNHYAIWQAFNNRYWPALYLADADGVIRHHHFGEGGYERSESILRQLLAETGAEVGDGLVSVDPDGVEAAADWNTLASAETYLGYGRTENFASPHGLVPNRDQAYTVPPRLALDEWALEGRWTIEQETVVLAGAEGRIACRFHARDVHLVMGPAAPGDPLRFRVLLDGRAPEVAHGIDVDESGAGSVTEPRLYQLIRQPGVIEDRTLEITFSDPGVHAYVLTFG
jgi:thiol-disulfide isomerase/thioredoxin